MICSTRLALCFLAVVLFAPSALTDESEEAADAGQYSNRTEYYLNELDWVRPEANWRELIAGYLPDFEVKYSQGFEELVIRDFFRGRKGGVYVDVGCWLPRRNSTTYFLERHLEWSGIAIDAAAYLEKNWTRFRANTKFFAYAVTDVDGETITFHLADALSSIDQEQAESFGNTSRAVEVPTITLTTLLDQNGVEKIDFLSMDIEGGEPGALAGFDIERFRPELVCVEKLANTKALKDYFVAHGYEIVERYEKVDKINWYFQPKKD